MIHIIIEFFLKLCKIEEEVLWLKIPETLRKKHILCIILLFLLVEGVIYAKYIYSMTESGSIDMGIMVTDVIG